MICTFSAQRYNKKCTYASKASLFLKNNRFYLLKQFLCYSLEACLHKSMQRGRFIRRSRIFQNRRAPLEYGLHWANVATGELLSKSLSFCENNCSARQMSEGTTKKAHTQAFGQKNTFFLGKKCTVRNLQVTEMAEVAEKFPPLPPLPPYCVVKNRVLIFKEEGGN